MSKSLAHLAKAPLPAWLTAAIGEIGQAEVPGPRSNARILVYRKMAGSELGGDDGAVPWCAIFINAMLASVNVKTSGSAMARSFSGSKAFERLKEPALGCITVISSSRGPASGHVFFYTGENGLFFQAVGGNQNDAVTVSMFHKSKLVGHFWPKGLPKPAAPWNAPIRLARPLLPHEKKAARDA